MEINVSIAASALLSLSFHTFVQNLNKIDLLELMLSE